MNMTPRVCFIVASTWNRLHLLEKCLEHYKQSKYCDCDIYLYFQGEGLYAALDCSIFSGIERSGDLRGPFTPRYELMKKYGINYDYTIVIDDDLFIRDMTDYDGTIRFIEKTPYVGCVCGANSKIKPFVELKNDINIEGGMVFPQRSIEAICKYFADKERDYTFDPFWLLLWVKGFDLYKDWRTYAEHKPCQKVSGKLTGFNETLVEKTYIPIMPEWFNDPPVIWRHKRYERDMPKLRDIKNDGLEERKRNMINLGRN